MSKQEINQELLREYLEKYKDESIKIFQEIMEEALEKKEKFEVEVPELDEKYSIAINGVITKGVYNNHYWEKVYLRGLVFDTIKEVERYDKELLLLFKIKKWAEIQNDGWEPKGNNLKYYIYYDIYNNKFEYSYTDSYNTFIKLPYFKTEKIAQACIDRFGEEILEVLC